MTRRRPNLRRLVNSVSAVALGVITAIGGTLEFLPSVSEYLPRWLLVAVAACAWVSRAVTGERKP